jgi:hypothetical protein
MVGKENYEITHMLSAILNGRSWEPTQPVPDWEKLFDCARRNAVVPLLGEVLEEQESIANQTRQLVNQTVLQSYHLLFATKYIVSRLAAEGIATVVLKGVSTAAYYAVPELRKSGDVDLLLLNPQQLGEATECLEKCGFCVDESQRTLHHLVMISPEQIELELHTMLAEPFDDGIANQYLKTLVWCLSPHVQNREIMGVSLPVLSDGVHAFQLLLHMLQHFLRSGFGIRLLCDWAVLWNHSVAETECKLYMKMVEDTGLKGFSRMITSICVYELGLDDKKNPLVCEDLFTKEQAEGFLRDIFEAEEFGKTSQDRMVTLRGTKVTDYLREFHHQMHLNYPKAGNIFLLWPALWVATLVRFLYNNKKVRKTSTLQILKKAGRRSSTMEQIRLFHREGKR